MEIMFFKSNGDGTCSVCGTIDPIYLNANVVIPLISPDGDRVTGIDKNAFYNCFYIKSVTIPESVTSIGDYAFCGCISLESVTIPENMTSIGSCAFYRCISLKGVRIPYSVTNIGSCAFKGCRSLKKSGRFKATDGRMKCRDFQFEVGKEYECEGEPKLCKNGFHFVENAFDLLNHYAGEIGKDIRIFSVTYESVSTETWGDSKRVCKKIRLVREYKSFAELLN